MSKKKNNKTVKKSSKPASKKKPAGKKAPAGKKTAPKKVAVKKTVKTKSAVPGNIKSKSVAVQKVVPVSKARPVLSLQKPVVVKNNGVPPVKTVVNAAPPKVKKEKVKVIPPPPVPRPDLPKLPKGIVLKKQRGKLAPGEKRIVKTDIITHHVISDLSSEEALKKSGPEPKGKFSLEYVIHSPVTLLYDFLTTPNGLAEWFADGVDMKNDIYTFDWDGQKQNAVIVGAKMDSFIRLRWMDKPVGSYFEFRIEQDELTGDVSLIVTDFGENEDDKITSQRLWDSQIQRLVKALGTY